MSPYVVRAALIGAVMVVFAAAPSAQEDSDTAAPQRPAAAAPPAAPDTNVPRGVDESGEQGAPDDSSERRHTSDDEFIPSEEIQADEEVTFPVDI